MVGRTTGPASAASGPAAGAANAVSPLAGLNKGAMAPLVVRAKPLDLPDFTVTFGEGGTKSLKNFTGKVVLLNIWATWCVPCRKEMPALDALETRLGGKDFAVVAVNIDKGGSEKAASFLKETGTTHLPLYTDPTGKLFATLKAVGMPTTLIIDPQGCELGYLAGPAEWASEDALKLLGAALGRDVGAATR